MGEITSRIRCRHNAAVLFLLMITVVHIAAEPRSFTIETGDAKTTLRDFAKQARVDVVMDRLDVQGVQTNEVSGLLEPRIALERMLEATPLVFNEDLETGAFAVTRSEIRDVVPVDNIVNRNHKDETNMKLKQDNWLKSLLTGLTMGILGTSADLSAQEKEEVTYELSPFTVDASNDNGYYSPNTLAGTRINSELRDLGTSIQVVTSQFLEDVGATDSTELLIYTTNTETGGATGNFSGLEVSTGRTDTQSARESPQSAQRVRGLFTADLTRNYFKSIIPFDSYNTVRIDINRGSNANLFGLGSPAGIINNQLTEATHSNFGNISARFADHGSARYSVDFNREIVDGKFSLRASALYDDRKYKQKPSFQNVERYFLAARFNPAENSTFKAHYEHGKIRANRPDPVSPKENISTWLLTGKPLLNNLGGYGGGGGVGTGIFVDIDGDGELEEAPASIVDAADFRVVGTDVNGVPINEGQFTIGANGMVVGPQMPTIPGAIRPNRVNVPRTFSQGVAVWSDSTSRTPNMAGWVGSYPGNQRAAGDALDEDGVLELRRFQSVENVDRYFSRFNRQGFVDANGFDFVNNLLAGTLPFQNQDFENLNFVFEQTFLDNRLGFEAAYDYQEFESDHFAPIQDNASSIWVDINTALPDGRPNPNVGRPFVNGRNAKGHSLNEQDSFRLTAYYKHDFSEQFDESFLGKLLGKHVFSGLYSTRDEQRTSYSQRLVWNDEQVLRALRRPGDHSHFDTMVNPYFYVGPSLVGIQSLDDVVLDPIDGAKLWIPGETAPITFWDSGSTPTGGPSTNPDDILVNGKVVTKDVVLTPHTLNSRFRREEISSKAATLQSHLWDGLFVTTVGYREDDVDLQTITGAPRDNHRNEILSRLIDEGSSNIKSHVLEDRWSWGVVGHLPGDISLPLNSRLSFHYAESSNFSPEPGRVDYDNRPLGSPSGDTTEKGFTLSALDNKFHIRVNWYETALVGKTASANLGNLTNNVIYQNADNAFARAAENTDPQYRALNMAVATTILANATDGENARYNPELLQGPDGPIGVRYSATVGASDTEDVSAEGTEFEIIFNPNNNWRLAVNIAEQQTVRTNMFPITTQELVPLRDELAATPVPGFEWLTIGQLARSGTHEDVINFDPATQTYELIEGGQPYTIADHLEGDATINKIFLRTAKAAEGSIATEQRRWRVNLINNYSFTEGRLIGINVGGAFRWQDRVGIGFPFITNQDGQVVGDVSNPYFADDEINVDLWIGYKIPLFQDYGRWRVQLNVRNAFADEKDIIPLQSQPDGTYSRVRFAPQREWFLSSSFDF